MPGRCPDTEEVWMVDVSSVVNGSLVVSQKIDYVVDCTLLRVLDQFQHQLSHYNQSIGRHSFHFEPECKLANIEEFMHPYFGL